jgi:hypothetical protein
VWLSVGESVFVISKVSCGSVRWRDAALRHADSAELGEKLRINDNQSNVRGTVDSEICTLLKIDLPIFAVSHRRDVVVEATKAGGFGVLSASTCAPEKLEAELTWISEHTDGQPYGVDVLIPTSYDDQAEAALQDLDRLIPQAQRDFMNSLLTEHGVGELPLPFYRMSIAFIFLLEKRAMLVVFGSCPNPFCNPEIVAIVRITARSTQDANLGVIMGMSFIQSRLYFRRSWQARSLARVATRSASGRADAEPDFHALNLLSVPWIEKVDISNTILFSASGNARYIRGVKLPVDAGQLAEVSRNIIRARHRAGLEFLASSGVSYDVASTEEGPL